MATSNILCLGRQRSLPRMVKIFDLTCLLPVTPPTVVCTLACLSPHSHRHSPAIWTITAAGGEAMDWKHLLAYSPGTVDQELLLQQSRPPGAPTSSASAGAFCALPPGTRPAARGRARTGTT